MAPLSSDSISDRFTTHPSGLERRIYARRAAAEIPWLSGVRLKYGPPVSLIDLSRGGAQIDAAAHRLRPGARVLVEIAGRDMEVVVQSRVVRCHVSALEPQAVYRAALAFERALDLPDVPSIARTIDLDTNPVYEHARPIQSQWNQIMLRYTDGRLLKGFSRDRLLTNGHVEVWALPDAPQQARITVPVRHLKAVIFLGGSEGEAAHAPEQAGSGARPAAVTFLDDEVIVGTVLDYKPDGVGFFLSPLDAETQDVRLFIFSGAIRHVRLLPA
jgi:PilZ domain